MEKTGTLWRRIVITHHWTILPFRFLSKAPKIQRKGKRKMTGRHCSDILGRPARITRAAKGVNDQQEEGKKGVLVNIHDEEGGSGREKVGGTVSRKERAEKERPSLSQPIWKRRKREREGFPVTRREISERVSEKSRGKGPNRRNGIIIEEQNRRRRRRRSMKKEGFPKKRHPSSKTQANSTPRKSKKRRKCKHLRSRKHRTGNE